MKNVRKMLIATSLIFLGISTTFAGKIWLEPSSGEFTAKCPFEVNIMVDTEGVESNTIGVAFYIDDSIFALNELNTTGAIFPAYTSFVRGKAWHGDRKGSPTISLMGTTAQKKGFTGKGKYATLKILPLVGVKSLDLKFYAIPGFSADDSNINYASGDTVLDALTEAIGGQYTFVEGGECPGYETPIPIPEDAEVILKTQDNDIFFFHQMKFLPKMRYAFIHNVQYVIIALLLVFILFIVFKKNKKDKEIVKKEIQKEVKK